ncbi:aminomethyl-transferring glycine dehydrogenase subunit GcvPB [Alkaliphilus peptidifermentans]|uniref:Glycine dehydrogenase (Decarboxylating) beta subunit n=1 Tax=Alkaliphilus peptidifermentans DSM 18978 TaxID=1120976 RepID=A0A1G5BJ03_9FIRM|nr:aminomethyl-transferring glycine dehydrogenase subunit GcvPB [Alkaliphilus peptidifermentans]SCX90182.1 glycine dehydrogenase (decarboxylating) beta subunit [Alkaliphilus peptidifermentans DSM 18978]
MGNENNKARKRNFHQARWNEPIIMEMGTKGERGILIPAVEAEVRAITGEIESLIPKGLRRKKAPALPEMSQMQVLRHYLRLSQETMGADFNIDIGLGTCTMKYNPKIHEVFVRSHKMTDLHPYQDESTVQGILEVLYKMGEFCKEISGLDTFTFQPTAGTQAIYSNASVVRAYHEDNGEGEERDEIITTIFSHPGNPAAASTAGYRVITLMPDESGLPDFEALEAIVSNRTAALIITNPEDTGIFNPRIKEFTDLVHSVGGLCIYDQANLNGVFGITRAKEGGFDMCHFNLHKTFSSPHGSQGPGAGAQGVTKKLSKYLPTPTIEFDGEKYYFQYNRPDSIGKLRKFYGVPPVVLRAYAYVMSLGAAGLKEVAEISILNNNYMLERMLKEIPGISMPMAEGVRRLEQARLSWEKLKEDTGVGTDDIDRRIVDYGFQSYFTSHHPQIISEPFTPEPVETYSKADIDEYVEAFKEIANEAYSTPEVVKTAPHNAALSTIADPEGLVNYEKFACTWRGFKKYIQP